MKVTPPIRAAVSALLGRVADELIVPAQADARLLSEDSEPVTEVDLESEVALQVGLTDIVAADAVLGEESAKSAGREPGEPDWRAAPVVWVIDPVDGTGNYARGSSDYGSMVALVVDGETEGAWIWSRRHDAVFSAVRGGGVQCDGVALPAPRSRPGAGRLADRYMGAELAAEARRALEGWSLTSPSCAATDYPALLVGDSSFSVYRRVRPWDHAAGTLLVVEAGGAASCLDGRRYRPDRSEHGLVVSAAVDIHDAITPALFAAYRVAAD